MKKRLLILAGVLCIGCLLAGCGKEKSEETEKKEVKEEEPEVTYQVIGRESEDAYNILLTNSTEKVITGIQVKDSAQTEYPANMMSGSQKIEKDETVEFYYTPETIPGDNADEKGSDEKSGDAENDVPEIADAVINVVYSLQVTFEDGTVHELSSFAVDDIDEASICYEDEVAFLTYKSKSEDVEISTKEAELALKSDRDAAKAVADQIQNIGEVTLESEAAIQAARAAYDALTDMQKQMVSNGQLLAEQEGVLAALKQQAADQAAAQAAEQQSYDSYYYEDTSSGYSGGASQGTDSCLGDVILN